MFQKLSTWHNTRIGLLMFAVLELGIAYAVTTLAIDRGNLWFYLLTLVFLFGALQNWVKLAGSYRKRGKRARS